MRIVLIAALVLLLLVGHSSNAQADGGWTPEQGHVIELIYRYAEYYGLRDVDLDTMLRIARRESQYGLGMVGDHGTSIGVYQFNDRGVWLSTPFQQEYGLAGRWNNEANVAAAMWAVNRGMISHWRPYLHDAHWFDPVPSDPRKRGE